jgi:hypothetical protein
MGIWSFIVAFLVALYGSTIWYFIGHWNREKIKYDTFQERIKYFTVHMHPVHEAAFVLFEIFLTFFTLFILLTPLQEVRVYWIDTLLVLGLTIFIHMIWMILRGMDRDVSMFYHNYKKTNQALSQKDKAEQSIRDTKEYRKQIVQLILDFEQQIAQVTNPEEYHLKESIQVIDNFVKKQTKTINEFEDDVIRRFEKTLEQYFEQNLKVEVQMPNVSLDFKTQYNNVRSEIYETYTKIFNDALYDLIERKLFNTSLHITKGLQTLKNNEYSPTQELIQLILLSIDNIEGSPRELIDYLIEKKIVELEKLISYAIDRKIVWVFKSNLFESQEQLATISERLVSEDAYTLAIAFISNYFTRIRNVLAFLDKQKESNRTKRLFYNYQKVMDVDQTFYAESSVLENKALSLQEFFKGKSPGSKIVRDINTISVLEKAYKNQDLINEMYATVQDSFDDIRTNAISSLLMYSGVSETANVFDLIKTSRTINDFYNRLLINDLILGSLLLYAIFLQFNKEEDLFHEVIQALQEDSRYKSLLKGVNLDQGFAKKDQIANAIIKDVLLKKEAPRVANILLRFEKQRAVLQQLKNG